ncbi:MAG: cyclic nucleotide-binding domain-containing protein [Alphaproteobacteria bacterium]|nr:cyclic nucleotide-binding domain-containing protein [Alphaproteobacteria bacterium]
MSTNGDQQAPAGDDLQSREYQMFPHLSEEMAGRIAAYGDVEDVPAGTVVFRRGQRSVDFFLVLDGSLEIFDMDEYARENVFTVHGPRQFTGEVDLFNDHEILVSARTAVPTRLARLDRATFRQMMAAEADIGELVMRAFILRRVGLMRYAHGGVVLVGPAQAADTLRIQRFLTRNGYPLRLVDTEHNPNATNVQLCFQIGSDHLPAVIVPGGAVLRNPSVPELADRLGLTGPLDPGQVHDVVVVGAGPAGLAAAVYAASEGLDVLVVEGLAPGGQAGTSSRIENYLGFPTGISGQALAARAQIQAQKFGARMAISRHAVRLHCDAFPYRVETEDGALVTARAVVIATGARYRALAVPDYARFEGQGVHYAATAMEGQLCRGQQAVVVGGGNSAGQAAVFLSGLASHVHILVRGAGLSATMSDYLIRRIDGSQRITLHTGCEITKLEGDAVLRAVTWTCRDDGAQTRLATGNLFVMIGASPNTAWLDGCLELDPQGFVRTGRPAPAVPQPSAYEASLPGIYAVGDVRAESVKRVASAVGEGSVVVHAIHRHLADHPVAQAAAQ